MQIKPEHDLSSRERVYQCIVELNTYQRAASRKRICEMTGLDLHIVDEQIRQLKNTNKIRKLENGVYDLVLEFPPDEPISLTQLPSGKVKIERGDDLWDLNPSEARTLGRLLKGFADEIASLHVQQNTEVRIARLENERREHQQREAALLREAKHLRKQVSKSPRRQRELDL